MKKTMAIISTLILLGLLATLMFFSFQKPETELEKEPDEKSTQETQNPIEDEIPNVNPTANTNPFSDIYKNPFE